MTTAIDTDEPETTTTTEWRAERLPELSHRAAGVGLGRGPISLHAVLATPDADALHELARQRLAGLFERAARRAQELTGQGHLRALEEQLAQARRRVAEREAEACSLCAERDALLEQDPLPPDGVEKLLSANARVQVAEQLLETARAAAEKIRTRIGGLEQQRRELLERSFRDDAGRLADELADEAGGILQQILEAVPPELLEALGVALLAREEITSRGAESQFREMGFLLGLYRKHPCF